MFIRAYLRASTADQDAGRARADLGNFCKERGLKVAAWYQENESGSTLDRPELFRLLADAQHGDVLLVEQVDRLSRLNTADWQRLRSIINEKGVRVVALDLPTSHQLAAGGHDEFTGRMFDAINGMLLDMLAAISRKDYDDRRRRQAQGIAKAKAEGRYRGRPADEKRNGAIADMLNRGMTYSQVQDATGAARATVAKIAKRIKKQMLRSHLS
ncbi:MAG: recombinase family protein [Rhizobiaceae bacterium]|nr:recombinase family protein [Rhizobiaceae bacterium]